MNKKLNAGTHILTTGRDLVSEHVEYIFNMIAHKYAKGLVNQIAFNTDLPADQFGSFHGPSRSICANITAHLANNLQKIQSKNPNMSIRALLIMELVNTALHETRHALAKAEKNDFADFENDAEEKICQTFADENMWDVALFVDLEIQSFGKLIDGELTKLFHDLRAAKDTDTFHQWQMNQLNMLEKGILYLDEKNEVVIKTMFELCSYFSKLPNWENATIMPFHANQTQEPVTAAKVDDDCPFDTNIYLHHPESESLLIETDRKKADEMLESEGLLQEISKEKFDKYDAQYKADEAEYNTEKETPALTADEHTSDGHQPTPVNNGPTVCQHEDYDVLESYAGADIVMPDELPEMIATPDNNLPAYKSPVETLDIPQATAQTVEPTVASIQGNIRVIAEMVFRRLFHHFYSKCGWDGRGNFANAAAVLEAVAIDDIAGATELFQKMDSSDNMGVYKPQQQIGAYITGLVSKDGKLPYYRIYINQGGQLHRRTFIPQNPDKMKDQQLTKWAAMVRDGWRITMLLADGEGPKLDMKTEPGQALGQESFNPWTK